MASNPETDAGDTTDIDSASRADEESVGITLEKILAYARERSYRGWDYGDGMSSRLLKGLPFESTILNLVVQEVVKRTPINVRPFLLIEQRRNYKGAALFAMANRTAHRVHEQTPVALDAPAEGYLAETEALVEWLVENQCVGFSGFCGGHRHELQHPDGRKGVPNDPDVVSTSYAVRALLRAGDLSPKYAEVARSAASFVDEDLNYRPTDDGAVINYHMNHSDDVFTVNAGALGARLLLDLYDQFLDPGYRDAAEGLLDHVASLQTDRGGWYYRDPPVSSHLSMDNHHNGFVIEAFQHHAEVTGSSRYDEVLSSAFRFYRGELFEDDGSPNFDERNRYPQDIHAATQGILVFTYAGDYRFARRIVEWTLEELSAGMGRFYFRKHRLHTKRHVLMRWCEAWMAYALSEYLRCRFVDGDDRVTE